MHERKESVKTFTLFISPKSNLIKLNSLALNTHILSSPSVLLLFKLALKMYRLYLNLKLNEKHVHNVYIL